MADDTTHDEPSGSSEAGAGPRVAVRPAGLREHLHEAVRAGGGTVVEPDEAELLVWTDPKDPGELESLLAEHPSIRTVQLLWAGVESFAERGMFDDDRTWACGKGVYADPVAEHALALLLAGMRGLPARAAATSWGPQWGTSLLGARVTVLGGGGIAESLVRLLGPFDADVTVVRRSTRELDGVARTLPPERTLEALRGADAVVLALALTPETTGVIDAEALEAMEEHAWLVNVARGAHVVTDDLVAALAAGTIAGAGLDVTDPEPLPDGHPLWHEERCVITPHTANTEAMAEPLIAERVRRNVERFGRGEPLIGLVDAERGY